MPSSNDKGPRLPPAPSRISFILSERLYYTGVEISSDKVIDAAPTTSTGEALRRQSVSDVIDADVEAETVLGFKFTANVMIEDISVELVFRIIGVFGRAALLRKKCPHTR